jgi:hypothetical protein
MENTLDPNYVPNEYKVPYDVIELPSQGLLYPNKKSSVKIEYLTAMDENVLSSPNILGTGKVLDVLIERKVKDLGFPVDELLEGDRLAIIIFLRTTAFGVEYKQAVLNNKNEPVEGTIDLSKLDQKKLVIKPDERNEFDFVLPQSKKNIKFRFLNSKDEKEIIEKDEFTKKKFNTEVSFYNTLKLERMIMEIDGNRDKLSINNFIEKKMTIMDSRKLNKFISDNEPGLNFKTTARTEEEESVECFLRLGKSFFWPEF